MSLKPAVSAISLPRVARGWLPDGVLDPLVEINGQCIEMLCAMAAREPARLPILKPLAPLWRSLPEEARRRLAFCPFLLVDAGFGDAQRWWPLPQHRVNDQPRVWRAGCFGGERARAFNRQVLVYGWHLARAHRSVARIVLGMSPACIERIAALSLRDLDGVCDEFPGWVRPRWETQPLVWRQLLAAALQADAAALQEASLRGIQLIAAAALGTPVRLRPNS